MKLNMNLVRWNNVNASIEKDLKKIKILFIRKFYCNSLNKSFYIKLKSQLRAFYGGDTKPYTMLLLVNNTHRRI